MRGSNYWLVVKPRIIASEFQGSNHTGGQILLSHLLANDQDES